MLFAVFNGSKVLFLSVMSNVVTNKAEMFPGFTALLYFILQFKEKAFS